MEGRNFLITICLLMNIIFLLAISGCHAGQWIYFHGDEIKGYVVDAETNEPVEGAIVVAMWGLVGGLSGGYEGYAKVILVKTDREGRFLIPSWKSLKPWKVMALMEDLAPEIVIYKPGYKLYWSHKIMRAGYPDSLVRTPEEKKEVKEKYSINPAKLSRIYTDEERFENCNNWGTEASFPDKHFSKEQSREIFNALEEEISHVSDNNKDKHILLNSIKKMREYWVGGKK